MNSDIYFTPYWTGGIFLKQILFNLILFSVEFIFFIDKALKPELRLSAGLVCVFLFWAGNLYFLHEHEQKQFPEYLKNLEDYQNALKRWIKKSNPFRHEIRTALQQLEAFAKKQRTLNAFDSSFETVSAETEAYLLTNMR